MDLDVTNLTLSEVDRQELIRWSVACAARLLPEFDAERPDDRRLTDALDGARAFAAGNATVGQVRALALGCHAAARAALGDPARAVARVCGQAVAVAHMAGHSREIERYTRKVLRGETLTAELRWQREHLPNRFQSYVYRDGQPRTVGGINDTRRRDRCHPG